MLLIGRSRKSLKTTENSTFSPLPVTPDLKKTIILIFQLKINKKFLYFRNQSIKTPLNLLMNNIKSLKALKMNLLLKIKSLLTKFRCISKALKNTNLEIPRLSKLKKLKVKTEIIPKFRLRTMKNH
jgi:hypothetical protein